MTTTYLVLDIETIPDRDIYAPEVAPGQETTRMPPPFACKPVVLGVLWMGRDLTLRRVGVIGEGKDEAGMLADFSEFMSARKPHLVFNLVESFGDDLMGGVIGVAGVLDLLQIPYTGGGPGEIFLQEDKALTKKLLAFEGIRYPDFATFPADANFETGGNLRMPLFVKPLRMDASIGIDERSLVRTTQQHLGTRKPMGAHAPSNLRH